MHFGIPEYRLPRNILDGEIEEILNTGIELKTSTPINSIDPLFGDGFDVVLIAIGTHQGQRLAVPGVDIGNGRVFVGTDFLRQINMGHKVEILDKVLVLGGGNVAFDCARVALRLGAGKVYLACLESRDTMPASVEEISQGEEEGVVIHPARNVSRIIGENGEITGVEFQTVSSFSFDEENNPEIEVINDSEHILEANTLIFAIGQRPEIPEGFGLETRSNLISVDSFTQCTSREGIFAAGDAVNGTSSIIKAIASGRKAATAIDRYLGGNGIIDEKLTATVEPEKFLGRVEGFALMSRCQESRICVEERAGNFKKVTQDLDEKTAVYESERCLQCDLRFKITPVKFWGNY
jgi:formate dehydrogenase beta subunit